MEEMHRAGRREGAWSFLPSPPTSHAPNPSLPQACLLAILILPRPHYRGILDEILDCWLRGG